MVLQALRDNANDITRPLAELGTKNFDPSAGIKAEFGSKSEQNFQDHQNEIALGQGQLSFTQINRLINESRSKEAMRYDRDEKSRKDFADRMWRFLLEQLQHQLDAVNAAIDGHRDYFADKYGEDWVETLGGSILGDDMPDRLPGESDAEYQARVEDAIFDEICNPDGTLKDEYKHHPDAERLEQWGKDRVRQQKLENGIEKINNAETPEAKLDAAEETMETADVKDAWGVAAGVEEKATEEVKVTVVEAHDEERDVVINAKGVAPDTEGGFGMRS